jgi:hypothetical protein
MRGRWGSAMGHSARVGRVELLAVAVQGVGGARKADWDVGMFRWAGRGWPNGGTGRTRPCAGHTSTPRRNRPRVRVFSVFLDRDLRHRGRR